MVPKTFGEYPIKERSPDNGYLRHDWKKHKWLYKEKDGGKTRYFYTEAAHQAFLLGKKGKKALSPIQEALANGFTDRLSERIVDRAKKSKLARAIFGGGLKDSRDKKKLPPMTITEPRVSTSVKLTRYGPKLHLMHERPAKKERRLGTPTGSESLGWPTPRLIRWMLTTTTGMHPRNVKRPQKPMPGTKRLPWARPRRMLTGSAMLNKTRKLKIVTMLRKLLRAKRRRVTCRPRQHRAITSGIS